MSALFREALLSTSRVIWPAEPPDERAVITLRVDSRIGHAQAYVGLLAYPGEHEGEGRHRFVKAGQWLAERMRANGDRPDLPRDREIHSAMQLGLKRAGRALRLAEMLTKAPFDAAEVAASLAEARTRRRVASAAPVRPNDVRRRDLASLPVIHLALPIVAARLGVTELELAPRGIPERPVELFLNADWPFVALFAAEHWRRRLAMPELIEVRARWLY